ncbi:MAG: pantetheine-phosphate adenylyltransferase [Candidatus Omnitrophota bacterium]|nr:pantetheine-phosphate adenylyltransferase [Candidatus Omnitrophota bacterium]
MCEKAIYPGSFDPVTYGHLDLIKRALSMFSEVTVAVANNADKNPIFTVKERVQMLKKATRGLDGVIIEDFNGLVVEYARKKHVHVIIRGIRMLSDFEYEFQMALTNRRLAAEVETIFLMPSEQFSFLSSRLLKEAAGLGADLSSFVPSFVEKALKERLKLKKK